jgi:predicted nucleic acid-binding protein
MFLCDTNILSTFAKIDRMQLLLHLFARDEMAVVPAVYEELQQGIRLCKLQTCSFNKAQ